MRHYLIFLSFLLIACGGGDEEPDTKIDGFTVSVVEFDEDLTGGTSNISLNLRGTLASDTDVAYSLRAGTAQPGVDFQETAGTLTFDKTSKSAALDLTILDDEHFELTEVFYLVLNADGNEFAYTLTINDDDAIGEVLEDENGYYTPDNYTSMTLAFSEEFEGTELNPATWNYELGDGCDVGLCGWGNNELQSYTDLPENVKVQDGFLTITAEKIERDFYSARITTKNKVDFQFGRIDIRAKLPKGQGVWPALWLLGKNIDDVSWPACGEIDIMELVGHEPEIVHGTVHYDHGGYKTNTARYTLNSGDFSDKFHVFTLVWEEDIMSWYVDNQIYRSFIRVPNTTYPFNSPFFFIANIAVGGNWPGNPDGTTVFPQTMEVDYIRVFK
ncbi:family 16 glycosylhydrolase [Fulvivirga sedimenti]|uniref:Family 16 glycosylhydrolase n=1 Tax=Fulvivirga sedimenti TaxID=2879465 RepID=A0A9X1L0L5_9BACT|nr:family 16 glycosylhydrolase [Fulvivirga sedimenti]MCA6077944.1 family 16 glycosylhydrolase [Fulvivirga sedimenti]